MNSSGGGGRHSRQQGPAALGLAQLLTVGDQTDESGRLLLEDSASSGARRRAESRGILMHTSPCPYGDTPSRLGGRMNVSAYEALRADATGILDGFAWLTGEQLAARPSAIGTVQLLYEISYLGLTLPLVLFHRAADPVAPHGGLPTVVASIFKASRGLFSVAVALLNQGGPPSRSVGAREVIAFADRHGDLLRPDPPRVCAAPTRLIERTIAVILSGKGATASASCLPTMVTFANLWRFYRVQDELSQALSTYGFILAQLSRAHANAPPERLFGHMVPGTNGTFGQLTEAMVGHANSSQAALNGLLGREGDAPTIGVQGLLALL
jgi:hypothetical protein